MIKSIFIYDFSHKWQRLLSLIAAKGTGHLCLHQPCRPIDGYWGLIRNASDFLKRFFIVLLKQIKYEVRS